MAPLRAKFCLPGISAVNGNKNPRLVAKARIFMLLGLADKLAFDRYAFFKMVSANKSVCDLYGFCVSGSVLPGAGIAYQPY